MALTTLNRMLIVDPATGTARQVGSPLELPVASVASGFDFNPAVDRLRLVSTADNVRWNPVTFGLVDGDLLTGGVQPDTDIAFIATDTNVGDIPSVVGEAYTNNDVDGATPTTLFGIEAGNDVLVRQGANDGNAADVAGGGSPNGGRLTTIGPLGIPVDDGALDVATPTGGNVAWAALHRNVDTASGLYTVSLTTGAATLVGTIQAGDRLAGLTILPGGDLRVTSAPTVAEGAGTAVVRVARLGDSLAPVQVSYRTRGRTAVAGTDYTEVTGVLSFAQGERTKDVAVPIAPDKADEPDESFAFELGTPVGRGAVVDSPASVVEILDDDPAPDKVKPAFLAAPTAPATLRSLRSAGRLTVDYACSEACVVRFTLKMGKTTLGTAISSRGSAGVTRASVRITTAGKKALARSAAAKGGRVKLTLGGTATDPAGNAAARSATLSVRRR